MHCANLSQIIPMHSAQSVHEGGIISVTRLPSKAVVSVRSGKSQAEITSVIFRKVPK
jgi:hypothetical protein